MKQYEAVIKAMEDNGGYCSLGHLYQNVPIHDWKTKTPFASIRRIVQDERFFFKIKPGLWALKSHREKLPNSVSSLMNENDEHEVNGENTHTFYQGTLVEIGNLKGYTTYVPPQDSRRIFLDRPLRSIVRLNEVYQFTFSETIRRIRSIDVIWFNDRRYPACVFEVEHTTNFSTSLLKFLELQDFNVRMNIVSHQTRRRDFEDKLNLTGFTPIRHLVRFLSYEDISRWNARLVELVLTEQQLVRPVI